MFKRNNVCSPVFYVGNDAFFVMPRPSHFDRP